MRRRSGDWLVGFALCGSLITACAHTAGNRNGPDPAPEVAPSPPDAAVPDSSSGQPILDQCAQQSPAESTAQRPRIDILPQVPPDVPSTLPAPPVEDQRTEVPTTAPEAPTAKETGLLAALRCFMNQRPVEALAHLKQYDSDSQSLLLCLMPLVVRLTESRLAEVKGKELALVIDQIDNTLDPLRARANLTIDQMCFCRSFQAFGVYDLLRDDHRFQPGEFVHVYVEIRNFASQKRSLAHGGLSYEVELASKVEIRDAAGKTIWSRDISRNGPNCSQSPRRDYFEGYDFALPELAQGLYTLHVHIVDVATQRKASRSLDFHVAALPLRRK